MLNESRYAYGMQRHNCATNLIHVYDLPYVGVLRENNGNTGNVNSGKLYNTWWDGRQPHTQSKHHEDNVDVDDHHDRRKDMALISGKYLF